MEQKTISRIIIESSSKVGLWLGVYFILKYLFFLYSIPYVVLTLFYFGLTIMVPYVMYILTKRFRNTLPLEIPFTFAMGWLYSVLLIGFASILVMPLHYYFYAYRLPEIIPMMIDMIHKVSSQYGVDSHVMDIFDTYLSQINLQPKYMLLWSDFTNNIFIGSIIALFIGGALKRNPKKIL